MNETKTLYKIKEQASISGVCAGLADYTNTDVTLVRVLFVIISLFTGVPLILYIVFAIVLPEKPLYEDEESTKSNEYEYDEEEFRL